MQIINTQWQQHVMRNATQICHCLKLSNGTTDLYLTDHDRPLSVFNEVYLPDEYLAIEGVRFSGNLQDDAFKVSTQISDGGISYDLIEAEFLKNTQYSIHQVNWENTDENNLLKMGFVGDVTVNASELSLTLHGIAKPLSHKYGRLLQEKCDAQFGDSRCNIDAGLPIYNASGVVSLVASAHRFEVELSGNIASGYFDGGKFSIGQQTMLIHSQTKLSGNGHLIILKQAPKTPVEVSDIVNLCIGCDKSYKTCVETFNNGAEFRGFAQMPGKDFKFAYPQRSLLEE